MSIKAKGSGIQGLRVVLFEIRVGKRQGKFSNPCSQPIFDLCQPAEEQVVFYLWEAGAELAEDFGKQREPDAVGRYEAKTHLRSP